MKVALKNIGIFASVWFTLSCTGTLPGEETITDAEDSIAETPDIPPIPDAPNLFVSLPFAVDDEFIPSGYMGLGASGGVTDTYDCPTRAENPVGLCHRFSIVPSESLSFAGVWWQYPENNWDNPDNGKPIEEGAQTVRFTAWTEAGGETVTFKVGMGGTTDTFGASVDVELTSVPTEYVIYVGNYVYEKVVGGFAWEMTANEPSTLFIDAIRWTTIIDDDLAGCMDEDAYNYVPGAVEDSGNCTYSVGFSVDLSCAEVEEFSTVYVTGTFCDWCAEGYPLADEDGDGIYTGSFAIPTGEYEYTYQLDQFTQAETLTDDVAAGFGECAPVNSGPFSDEYANRVLVVEESPLTGAEDTYGSCLACGFAPPEKEEVSLSFSLDTSLVEEDDPESETGAPDAEYAVCGSWAENETWTPCTPLALSEETGLWEGSLSVVENASYQFTYKRYEDESDPASYQAEAMVDDPSCQVGGGNLNRLVVVESDDTALPTVCWGLCGDCEYEAPTQKMISFAVDMQKVSLEEGQGVAVCGSWNGWWPCTAMEGGEGSSVYTIDLEFSLGASHEYVYKTYAELEDGESYDLEGLPEEADLPCQVGDENTNRSLIVDDWEDTEAVCWGLCSACLDDSIPVPGCTDPDANNFDPNANEEDGNCLFPVTFQVDLSCYEGNQSSVFLNGPFNAWCGSCAPMAKTPGTKLFSITVALENGNHEYKFVPGGNEWETLEAEETSECTLSTEEEDEGEGPGQVFTNRLTTVTGEALVLPLVTPGSCSSCPQPVCGDEVCEPNESCVEDCDTVLSGCTDSSADNFSAEASSDDGSCVYSVAFEVDMSCAVYTPVEGDEVLVMGLNAWDTDSQIAATLTLTSPNLWTGTWTGPAGDYEYILSVGHWVEAGDASYWNNGFGIENLEWQRCAAMSTNRNLSVTGPSTVSLTHSYCDGCPDSGGDIFGCMEPSATNYDASATENNGTCTYMVLFTFTALCAPGEGASVAIQGAFNEWCLDCDPLLPPQTGTSWTLSLALEEGPQEYKFVVDGVAESLPPGQNCTLTTGETTNRVVEVSTSTEMPPVASYGSCWDCP